MTLFRIDTRRRLTAERSSAQLLRDVAIGAGVCWAILFVLVGVGFSLELFGDGAYFSYAIAVLNMWDFWQNVSGRLFAYVYAHLPAEAYVALTGDAKGAIALYGFLFFVAPLLGLAATFKLDRSPHRTYFSFACASTACLCPLVFGFPTETWYAHSLFWPALALAERQKMERLGTALLFCLLLALLFTHEGALIFAAAILIALSLRGTGDPALRRFLYLLTAGLAIWVAVKVLLPPGKLMSEILARGALHVFDPRILTFDIVLLILAEGALYAMLSLAFWRAGNTKSHVWAAAIVAFALAVWWIGFDDTLHTTNRYYLRTIILLGTPAFGLAAALLALRDEGSLPSLPWLQRRLQIVSSERAAAIALGAFALLMLIHAVETEKFVAGWVEYKRLMRELAASDVTDPPEGDPRFVSVAHLNGRARRYDWNSTVPYLSVLLAPGFKAEHLAIHPYAGYFWLNCRKATELLNTPRAIPRESRNLIQIYSCLYRWD